MKRYSISFRYSRDGRSWTRTSTTVMASSESGAIAQVKSKYPYESDNRIMSIRRVDHTKSPISMIRPYTPCPGRAGCFFLITRMWVPFS